MRYKFLYLITYQVPSNINDRKKILLASLGQFKPWTNKPQTLQTATTRHLGMIWRLGGVPYLQTVPVFERKLQNIKQITQCNGVILGPNKGCGCVWGKFFRSARYRYYLETCASITPHKDQTRPTSVLLFLFFFSFSHFSLTLFLINISHLVIVITWRPAPP